MSESSRAYSVGQCTQPDKLTSRIPYWCLRNKVFTCSVTDDILLSQGVVLLCDMRTSSYGWGHSRDRRKSVQQERAGGEGGGLDGKGKRSPTILHERAGKFKGLTNFAWITAGRLVARLTLSKLYSVTFKQHKYHKCSLWSNSRSICMKIKQTSLTQHEVSSPGVFKADVSLICFSMYDSRRALRGQQTPVDTDWRFLWRRYVYEVVPVHGCGRYQDAHQLPGDAQL